MARNRLGSSHFGDGDGGTTCNKIVDWLNQAALSTDAAVKCENLQKAQEVIIHSSVSSLLDNFLHEVLGFQIDRNAEVRKFIVGFIEEACKKDPDILPKVVMNINLLLQDSSAQVQKRVIQAAGPIYKTALKWLSKAKSITEEMEAAWKVLGQIKQQVINMIDNDNDGCELCQFKDVEESVEKLEFKCASCGIWAVRGGIQIKSYNMDNEFIGFNSQHEIVYVPQRQTIVIGKR